MKYKKATKYSSQDEELKDLEDKLQSTADFEYTDDKKKLSVARENLIFFYNELLKLKGS